MADTQNFEDKEFESDVESDVEEVAEIESDNEDGSDNESDNEDGSDNESDNEDGSDGESDDESDDESDAGEANDKEDNQKDNDKTQDDIDFDHKTEDVSSVYSKLNIIYKDGKIEDPNHKTTPFMTRYEYTNIISTRTKMLAHGGRPFVKVYAGDNINDIAMRELKEKKMPFIIQRPIPNGTFEYWRVKDLIPYKG